VRTPAAGFAQILARSRASPPTFPRRRVRTLSVDIIEWSAAVGNGVVFNGMIADNTNSGVFDDDGDKTGILFKSPDAIQNSKCGPSLRCRKRTSGGPRSTSSPRPEATFTDRHRVLPNDALNANDRFPIDSVNRRRP
jgi:hypothetical protein